MKSEKGKRDMNKKLLLARLLTVAVVLAAALALCACGSSAASGSAASGSSSTASASSAAASDSSASAEAPKAKKKSGTVTNEIDMTNYKKGDVIKLWLPVPQSDEYQKIESVKTDKGEIMTDELGNQMVYVEWDAKTEPKDRTVKLTWHVDRTEILAPEVTEDASKADPEAEKYLGGSEMVAVDDPAVTALAKQITEGKTTNYDKARAVYDWVYDNMVRDNSVKGCGQGDVCQLLSTKAGKCTDINSTFVGLCRAAGVPAREVFGIRINADDITGNQHCWASFYIPGTGWYSADPADVLKAILTNEWEKDSAEAQESKEYYWGNCDEKRCQLTEGRDLTLAPAQSDGKLNMFGYPYAEVNGKHIDYYDTKNFRYTYAFKEGAVAPKSQKGTVTNTVDMSSYEKGKVVKVWLPVPQTMRYQTIEKVDFKADTASKAEITTDELGNKMLYIEWDANAEPADRKATLSFHAIRNEILAPAKVREEGVVPENIEQYLQGSKMVAIDDGNVKATAEEITKGAETNYDKARAIYDWIYENMERDNEVKGCGQGDICTLLDTKAGKCTDINSVFVGLCRACGIPAREVFGIRMNDADITGNQHCWCAFYLPGTGWYSADPADVLKAVLNDKLDKTSDEALAKKEYYWGNCDEKRVQLSEGRDLTLAPAQDGDKLNMFGYPYAEVDGKAVDYYAPDKFVYAYAFEQDAK